MGAEKHVKGPEVPDPTPSATAEDPPAKATTTSEEDKHTRSQRTINLVWELTQSVIALTVVLASLYISLRLAFAALMPDATEGTLALATSAFLLLGNLASLVIGFYFGRTNHQRVGGVQTGR